MISASVRPLYMAQPSLTVHKARVTATGESTIRNKPYTWVQLNETIFHPQGGGQPSDQGTMNGFPVLLVNKVVLGSIDQFEIQHCFGEGEALFQVGQEVELKIDWNVRQLNMRMHTAGHAIADFVQSQFENLKASGGNHFPNDGYMKFNVTDGQFPQFDLIKKAIEDAFDQASQNEMLCQIENNDVRKLKIGSFEGVPCGGTHLSAIREIGTLVIGKITGNNKAQTITVKYSVA